jgi:hypothetical protein
VRESCYPFYEPSYTELPHGCSQEVQSKRQKEVAVRILRTQERRRSEADEKARKQRAQVRRKKVIASEVFGSSQERRTQVFLTEIFSPEEQRTEASSPAVAVSRRSREARSNRCGTTGSRPC